MRGVKLYLLVRLLLPGRKVIVPVRGVKLYIRVCIVFKDTSSHRPREGCKAVPFDLVFLLRGKGHRPREGCKAVPLFDSLDLDNLCHRPREGCKAVQQICTKNIRRNKAVPYRLSLAYHVWGTNTSTLPPKIEKRRALGGTVWCETPCSRPVSGREKRGFAHGPKGHCHDKKECTNREKHDIIKISS